jgi:hypothetical protein
MALSVFLYGTFRFPLTPSIRTARRRHAVFVPARRGPWWEVRIRPLRLLGPPGLAFMYVRRELIGSLTPTVTGWFGQKNPFAFDASSLSRRPRRAALNRDRRRCQTCMGPRRGWSCSAALGWMRVASHVQQLTQALLRGAGEPLISLAYWRLRPPDRGCNCRRKRRWPARGRYSGKPLSGVTPFACICELQRNKPNESPYFVSPPRCSPTPVMRAYGEWWPGFS